MEVELTELYDLQVERHDGVANPASGFSFLVTKSAAVAAVEPPKEAAPVNDETQPTEKSEDAPVATETSEATEKSEAPAALTEESVQELIKAALAERDSEAESLRKELAETKSELDVLKAKPIPGGPLLSATAEDRAFKAKNEAVQKAAYYRRLANTVNDRELAVEYNRRAKALEAEAA